MHYSFYNNNEIKLHSIFVVSCQIVLFKWNLWFNWRFCNCFDFFCFIHSIYVYFWNYGQQQLLLTMRQHLSSCLFCVCMIERLHKRSNLKFLIVLTIAMSLETVVQWLAQRNESWRKKKYKSKWQRSRSLTILNGAFIFDWKCEMVYVTNQKIHTKHVSYIFNWENKRTLCIEKLV